MLQKLRQSEFLKSVLVLMTASVVSLAINVLISPILTRIYSAEQIGDVNLYTRIVAFISTIATVRYELSLPIAKQQLHAFHLYRLTYRIALVILTGIGIVGLLYALIKPVDTYSMWFMLLVIIGAYLSVWINIGINWSIRTKGFKRISQQRIIASVVSNGLKWFFGMIGWKTYGLLVSLSLGYLASSVLFMLDFVQQKRTYRSFKATKRMRVLSKEYRQFPIMSLPHVMIDLGVDLAMASLIIGFYSKADFGLFSHAYGLLKMPIGIVGQSIGQVFTNRFSELIHSKQKVVPLFLKTTRTLFLLSIVPFTVLFFFGEPIFAFVFGKEWATSGAYASIMIPWLMLNFLLSPISSLPMILGRQKEALIIGIISGAGQLLIFGALPELSAYFRLSFEHVLWVASGFQSVLLIAVFYVYYRFAMVADSRNVRF
jgi:O-antigen/teichoic acid export membrane protein